MSGDTLPLVAAMAVVLIVGSEAGAQSQEVVSGNDTISYVAFGQGNTTLLLVHGWSNNRTFWEPHLSALSRSHRVVTLDLASFGESTSHRTNWTIENFADDAEAVLDQIKAEKVVVVGFSMGGAVVTELASRGRDEVIGVVLVDILQDPEQQPTDEFMEGYIEGLAENWHSETNLRNLFSAEASPTLVRRYLSRTPAVVPDPWWEAMRNLLLWIRSDLRPTLRRVEVPIAAINSDRPATDVEAWRQYVPTFSVHLLGPVNHLGAIWERVDEFDRALIDFVEAFSRSR